MYLLDTSVFSFLYRADSRASLYAQVVHENAPIYLSVQTVAELLLGAKGRGWGETRVERLRATIANCAVLAADEGTAEHFVDIAVAAKRAGRAMAIDDLWIAATARQFDLTLVTHDSDFDVAAAVGVRIFRGAAPAPSRS